MPRNGITISVTAETNSGGRRHMEDYLAVRLSPNEAMQRIPELREQAYIGVFDGHGGKEAAKFAREHLWDRIQRQPKYASADSSAILESIKDAYLELHREMEPLRGTWKRNKMGDLSTAGTTACTVIFRQDNFFVANVGDSTGVMGVTNPNVGLPGEHPIVAQVLTKDHKPEDPEETRLIESFGGKVMVSRKGIPRVVWERRRYVPDSQEESVDLIPFLSVARSLGDFWSFNPRTKQFTVSPHPDVHVHQLDLSSQKFIVLATDGLWNVMTPTEVVRFIWDYEHDDEACHQPRDVVRALINEGLRRWKSKNLLADNIAVLIAFLSKEDHAHQPLLGLSSSFSGEVSAADTGVSSELRDNPISVLPIPSIMRTVTKTKSGSTTYYRETTADGMTISQESRIKLRQRRKKLKTRKSEDALSLSPTPASSRGDSGTSATKRPRPEVLCELETALPAKRSRVDDVVVDSGCDMATDSDKSSPISDGCGSAAFCCDGIDSPGIVMTPPALLGSALPGEVDPAAVITVETV